MSNDQKWQRHGGSNQLPAFKFTKKGQAIEGAFIAIKEVESDVFQSGSARFVEINVTKGPDGEDLGPVSLMGHGLLVWLLTDAKVKAGDPVRIEFGGETSYKKGKKTINSFGYELFTQPK